MKGGFLEVLAAAPMIQVLVVDKKIEVSKKKKKTP